MVPVEAGGPLSPFYRSRLARCRRSSNGGVQDLWQLFTRPVVSLNPCKTPAPGVYICSSSTPPGGAVDGLCGYYAARAALRGLG